MTRAHLISCVFHFAAFWLHRNFYRPIWRTLVKPKCDFNILFTAHKWDTDGLKFRFVDIQSSQQFKIFYCCRDPPFLLSFTGTKVYGKRESVPFMMIWMTLHFWLFTLAFWIESTNSHADENSKRINCVYGTVINFSLSTVDGNKRKYFASKNFVFILLFLFANDVFIQQTLSFPTTKFYYYAIRIVCIPF